MFYNIKNIPIIDYIIFGNMHLIYNKQLKATQRRIRPFQVLTARTSHSVSEYFLFVCPFD